MELEELINTIRSGRDEGEAIREMETLIERFPYFSICRAVYLKMLHDSGHPAYPDKLKLNTVHLPDHKQFYRFLHDLLPLADTRPGQVFKEEIIAMELLEDNEEEKDDSSPTMSYLLENEFPDEEFLPIEAIASEWLTQKKKKGKKDESLIDKFILSEPSMPKITAPEKKSPSSPVEETGEKPEFFSETLAKIYIRQQLYDKAIATYQKLNLKYPEKSIYFAVQIEKIKEKINNNTN